MRRTVDRGLLSEGTMRTLRLLSLMVVLSLMAWSPVAAGPVTGQPASESDEANGSSAEEDEQRAAFAASMLFDAAGLPMLRLSAPTYLRLDPHGKLRGQAADQNNNIFPGGGGVGNVGVEVPANFGNVPLPPNVNPGAVRIPEPATLLLMGPAVLIALRRRARSRQTLR